ncbi:MAG: ABC transporter ATP-binding protein [Anaerolineae bacterium]|nr:ABC transporter ATP-binding protein [Anaerolineae bacterium]
MEAVIEGHSLTKRFPSQSADAVHDVNLSVAKGQLYGLMGADGAGKTTTLRMLATVLPPSSGEVNVAGFDARTQKERIRSSIGYMPQSFSLYGDLTAEQNLSFFADINGVPRAEKRSRIESLRAFTRLDGLTNRRALALSGGQKKKLALACALVHDPAVLILDEPSTGVDPVSRRELWAILGRVVQRGVAVIVSTPYMDEAERCHQVAVLHNGRLLTSGTPDALERALPFEVLEVKASPRKEMRRVVGETPAILEWRPVGDGLRLAVEPDAADRVLAELSERFRAAEVEVRFLRRARTTMEDVFVHLVEGEGGVA